MLAPGSIVRHSARAEWGLGVVINTTASHLEVAFEHRGLTRISAALATKLEPVERDELSADSPLLDRSRWDELSLPPEQRTMPGVALPERLMRNVLWAFSGPTYDTLESFVAEVWRYQEAVLEVVTPEQRWRCDELVLPVSRVRVGYLCWRGARQVEPVVTITGAGPGLTAGELLWKVHNAVVGDLRELDHKFFEGLTLGHRGSAAEGPRYHLSLGS
jgi:hypothetical protein